VKDERSNLNTTTFAWEVVINYDILNLEESYQCACYGHAFSKAFQYIMYVDEKVCKDLTYVFIKTTQGDLQ
jgi:hypothetical protein